MECQCIWTMSTAMDPKLASLTVLDFPRVPITATKPAAMMRTSASAAIEMRFVPLITFDMKNNFEIEMLLKKTKLVDLTECCLFFSSDWLID